MKEIIVDSLIFMIPIWSSLGFLAFKRPVKFKKISGYLILICLIFAVFCIIWNVSGLYFGKILYAKKLNSELIDNIYEEHSITFYYSYLIPLITSGFVLFLKYVSETDSENKNEPKNQLN